MTNNALPMIKASALFAVVERVQAAIAAKEHPSPAELVDLFMDDPVELELCLHVLFCPQCMSMKTALVDSVPGFFDMLLVRAVERDMTRRPEVATDDAVSHDSGDARAAGSASDAVVVPFWQLQIPSGLQFKFDDPEAMLGWKKKLSTYKVMKVSRIGEDRCVDFAAFVAKFEEIGDAAKAFAECKPTTSFV